MASAYFKHRSVRVSLTFEQQKVTSASCSEHTNSLWCSHMVAAIGYRIRNAKTVSSFTNNMSMCMTFQICF